MKRISIASTFAVFLTTLSSHAADTTGTERARNLAAKAENGIRVKRIFDQPSAYGCHYLEYKIDKLGLWDSRGKKKYDEILKPDEAFYFAVPDEIAKAPLVYVVLGHRQDPKTQRGNPNKGGEKDEFPGMTTSEVYSDAYGEFRTPVGEKRWFLGKNAIAKFAEVRASAEKDAIWDIGRLGHVRSEDGKAKSRHPLFASALRVRSVGKDPIFFNEISLRTFPGESDQDDEQIFTPGTRFSQDSFKLDDDAYGGGSDKQKGHYPGALEIAPKANARGARLPGGWKNEKGQIAIPARAGMKLREVILKVGDAHPDEVKNDDGHFGSHGAGKLSVYVRHADGSLDTLMFNENVGPQATMRAIPAECDYVVRAGDEIVVRAGGRGITYLMGLKTRYSR